MSAPRATLMAKPPSAGAKDAELRFPRHANRRSLSAVKQCYECIGIELGKTDMPVFEMAPEKKLKVVIDQEEVRFMLMYLGHAERSAGSWEPKT